MHVERTKKGQPIMKNYIDFVLHKLNKSLK